MDATERTEVRDMIHGVLVGYHAKVDAQNTITNNGLKGINHHLSNLNHSILKHATELEDVRLAAKIHVIECPVAAEVINIDKTVNDIVTANKTRDGDALKTRGNTMLILMGIGIFVSIILGCVGIFKTDKVQTTTTNTDGKVDNINTPVKDPRTGKIYMWPAGLLIDSLNRVDSIKYIN